MNTLLVSIERDGTMISVGTFIGDDPAYRPEYLRQSDAAAISISLPTPIVKQSHVRLNSVDRHCRYFGL